jgi:hypothetical protein
LDHAAAPETAVVAAFFASRRCLTRARAQARRERKRSRAAREAEDDDDDDDDDDNNNNNVSDNDTEPPHVEAGVRTRGAKRRALELSVQSAVVSALEKARGHCARTRLIVEREAQISSGFVYKPLDYACGVCLESIGESVGAMTDVAPFCTGCARTVHLACRVWGSRVFTQCVLCRHPLV